MRHGLRLPGPSPSPPTWRRRASALTALALLALLAGAVAARFEAPQAALSGGEGHPRARFPLRVWAAPAPDPKLDTTLRDAVADWNRVFQDALGTPAFAWTEREADADVLLRVVDRPSTKLMGETEVDTDGDGVIQLPVRVELLPPHARGETPREILFYQVAAHELGHVLGLEHVKDARSIMCCVDGSIDFKDPVVREAYVDARRHPDLRSVQAQLTAHYRAFWATH